MFSVNNNPKLNYTTIFNTLYNRYVRTYTKLNREMQINTHKTFFYFYCFLFFYSDYYAYICKVNGKIRDGSGTEIIPKE